MIFNTIFFKNYGKIIIVVALYWYLFMFSEKKKKHSSFIIKVFNFYRIVSITTVFVNKHLLDDELDAPLFVTWFQCIVTTIILTFLSHSSKLNSKYKYFPKISPWNYDNFIKV